MKNRLLARLQDDFLRHNVVFFIGSMLVAFLNYIYHPIISRLLTVEDFGELQAYFSLVVQIGVISGVFGRIILNIKTNTTEADSNSEIVGQLYSLSTIINGIVALSLVLLSPYIGPLLNLPSFLGLLLTAVIIFVSLPLTFAKYELQAKKRFKEISIADLGSALGKLLFALLAIYFGGQALGALFGFFVAIMISICYVYPKTKETIHLGNLTKPILSTEIKKELQYGVLILIATSFTTFLFTSDILIIRYFFDTETAGLYAGIATIARIIIFATGSVAGVAIAHVKLRNFRSENHLYMNKSLVLVTSMSGGLLVIFSLFPGLVTKILIGERFLIMADTLPRLSLLMTTTAITTLFVMYFLALRRYILISVLAMSTGAIAVLMYLWHSSITTVINNLLYGVLFALMALVILYIYEPHQKTAE